MFSNSYVGKVCLQKVPERFSSMRYLAPTMKPENSISPIQFLEAGLFYDSTVDKSKDRKLKSIILNSDLCSKAVVSAYSRQKELTTHRVISIRALNEI